jgi:hypothetical protein
VDRIRWGSKKVVPSVMFKAYDLSLQFETGRKWQQKGNKEVRITKAIKDSST